MHRSEWFEEIDLRAVVLVIGALVLTLVLICVGHWVFYANLDLEREAPPELPAAGVLAEPPLELRPELELQRYLDERARRLGYSSAAEPEPEPGAGGSP